MTMLEDMLDLLGDGPSTVAAMYGSLIRACGYSRESLKTTELLRTAAVLVELGWARPFRVQSDGSETPVQTDDLARSQLSYNDWLPSANLDDLDVDEVGVWLELTDHGRKRWQGLGSHEDRFWRLDYRDGNVVVWARTTLHAQAALDWWLSTNPHTKVIGTPAVRSIEAFELRDGSRITPAVELIAHVSTISTTLNA